MAGCEPFAVVKPGEGDRRVAGGVVLDIDDAPGCQGVVFFPACRSSAPNAVRRCTIGQTPFTAILRYNSYAAIRYSPYIIPSRLEDLSAAFASENVTMAFFSPFIVIMVRIATTSCSKAASEARLISLPGGVLLHDKLEFVLALRASSLPFQ